MSEEKITGPQILEALETMQPWELQDHKLFRKLELNCANDYTEPGYSLEEGQKGVIFGNWNHLTNEGFDLLEKQFALEWCDEWFTCGECGGAVRHQCDSMHWSPFYHYCEGDITCGNCLDAAAYLQEVTQDDLTHSILRKILGEGLPEGWELLDDFQSFNGEPKHAATYYKERGFSKVLCYQSNCYSLKWILGYKDEEEDEE